MRALYLGLLASAALTTACGAERTDGLERRSFAVDQDLVDFGAVPVGTRAERAVEVQNDSTAPLTVRPVVGEDWDEAFELAPATLELPAGAARTLRLSFSPAASGPVSSTVRLEGGEGVPPVTLRLQGEGVAGCEDLAVSPRTVDFGAGLVASSQAERVRLENRGQGALDVLFEEEDNVGDCDGASGSVTDFCVAQAGVVDANGRIPLGAGEALELEVGFNPVVPGATSGLFTVRAAPGCDPIRVATTGAGVESALACDARVDFGTVFPGDCKQAFFDCDNLANAPLTIEQVEKRRGDPMSVALTVDAALPVTLGEGESATFGATYCPNERGRLDTRVRVTPASGDPVDVAVEGRAGGPNIAVTPGTLDFGEVASLAPARRGLTVRNSGFETLTVGGIDVSNPDVQVSPQVFDVAPGEARTLTVELESLQVGEVEATLTIRSNDPDTPEARVLVIAEALGLPSCSFRSDLILQMGAVEPGRLVSRSVLIENTGSADCLVTSVRELSGGDPELFLANPSQAGFRIAPGEVAGVRVSYAPDAPGAHTTRIELGISSRTQPFTEIPVEGSAVQGLPVVFPRDLDFTTLGVGCASRTAPVAIHNRSGGLVEVSSVELANGTRPEFAIVNPPPLPLTLQPGRSATFDVRFTPSGVGRFENVVRLVLDRAGQSEDLFVAVVGENVSSVPEVTERFVQAAPGDADVLLSLDWSGGTNRTRLTTAGLNPLVGAVEQGGGGWQVGVVPDRLGEGGVLIRGPGPDYIVDPGDPNPESLYTTILGSNPSSFTDPFRQLDSMERALSAPNVVGDNAGFLRRGARLAVLVSARTPEQSVAEPASYRDFLWSLKGAARKNDVSVSTFGGPPGGCSGSSLFASATPRVTALANLTGGNFEVYCDADWTPGLTGVGDLAAGLRSTWFLKTPAAPDSVEVRVDGVVLPRAATGGGDNYTFDAARGALVFTPAGLPEPGANIDVRYAPACP